MPKQGLPRERLAAWVTNPENRAFSRAIVNRMWALMTGKPLVVPIDDIPLSGPYPPGLESLADDFATHGFDLRRLIRLIAHTRPFQLDSRGDQGSPTERAESSWALFPVTRLRPEQVAGSLLQATSLRTIDANSHILVRFARYQQQNEFVQRFGDRGEDEFGDAAGTIPQRLLMMNGKLINERIKNDLVGNAVSRIARLAKDDETALQVAYLCTLTREPTSEEKELFEQCLQDAGDRSEALQDLYWALLNSSEFSWNH